MRLFIIFKKLINIYSTSIKILFAIFQIYAKITCNGSEGVKIREYTHYNGLYLWEILGCSKVDAINLAKTRNPGSRLEKLLKQVFGENYEEKYSSKELTHQDNILLCSFFYSHRTDLRKKYEGLTLSDLTGLNQEQIDTFFKKGFVKRKYTLTKAFGPNLDKPFNITDITSDEFKACLTSIYFIKNNYHIEAKNDNYYGKTLLEILQIEPWLLDFIMFDKFTDSYESLVRHFGPNLDEVNKLFSNEDIDYVIKELKKKINKYQNNEFVKKQSYLDRMTLMEALKITRETLEEIIPINKDLKKVQLLKRVYGENLDQIGNIDGLDDKGKSLLNTIVSNLRQDVANYKARIVLTESSWTRDSELHISVSIYYQPIYQLLVEFLPSEYREFMAYRLGIKDGYYHSVASLAEMYSMPYPYAQLTNELGTYYFKKAMLEYIEGTKDNDNDKIIDKKLQRTLKVIGG